MKTFAEMFIETLSERDKPLVRLDSKGNAAAVLDAKTQAGNRRVEANRHEVKAGHMLRPKKNTHERSVFVTDTKEIEPHPVHGGRQLKVTVVNSGKLFASDKPIAGYSTRRPDGGSYVPPKRLMKPRTIVLTQHPKNNGKWTGGGYMAVVPKNDQTPRVVKKRPGYGGF